MNEIRKKERFGSPKGLHFHFGPLRHVFILLNPRSGIVLNENTGSRTPLWGSANPKKRPKPSKNVPSTLYNHNIAQMGMVMHASKAKNDRIIDLFLVLDPKPYPGGYGPYPKIWDQDMYHQGK